MTKQQYDERATELLEQHREKILALQKEFMEKYDEFKSGDIVKSREGYRAYLKVRRVEFKVDRSKVLVLLHCISTNKDGEVYNRSYERIVKADSVTSKGLRK